MSDTILEPKINTAETGHARPAWPPVADAREAEATTHRDDPVFIGGAGLSQQLYVWRFTPVAARDDPGWQGRPIWTDLQIVAATAGEAILLASRYDQAARGLSNQDSPDRQQWRSGLEDPLLYRCDRLHPVTSPELKRGTVISKGELV